jgi:Acyl-CoA dehydrogenase, C-terminal domain
VLDERWGEAESSLADGLRRLLERACPTSVVRDAEARDDGRSPELEAALAAFGLDELADAAEPGQLTVTAWELGRALAPVTFVETAPVRAVLGLGGAACGLEGLAPAGAERVVVADGGDLVMATVDAGAGRRTSAGDVLAPARSQAGSVVVGGRAETDRLRRLTRLLGAARLVGASEGLLALGVEYAKGREQFGRPIASFQAVAHRLADAAVASDGAGLLVRKAAWVSEAEQGGDGAPDPLFATLAWAKAVEASRVVASHVHQCMGGYGFALEYDCQLFSRRIRSWSMRLGRPGPELASVARTLLQGPSRDDVRHLWHHDRGVPVPRWARELDGNPA